MVAAIVIALFIAGVFVFELGRMWWNQNAWKRRWRDDRNDPSKPA